jgi:hypothetical protein
MKFNVNDKVTFLHESGGGVIIKIEGNKYFVEDETGFDRPFYENELAIIHGTDYKLSEIENIDLTEDDVITTQKHQVLKEKQTGSLKAIDFWEIDLHIEEIVETHRGLTSYEILTKQLREFRHFFKKAKEKRVTKLVVIHGVGEGVLKEEIRSYLSKQIEVEFYDSDFREYGKGATTIELHYNYR